MKHDCSRPGNGLLGRLMSPAHPVAAWQDFPAALSLLRAGREGEKGQKGGVFEGFAVHGLFALSLCVCEFHPIYNLESY